MKERLNLTDMVMTCPYPVLKCFFITFSCAYDLGNLQNLVNFT